MSVALINLGSRPPWWRPFARRRWDAAYRDQMARVWAAIWEQVETPEQETN